jgi:predicted component of type VI protein secretion system
MAKLTLIFGDQILHEYPAGPTTTIGRLPDNTVVIDNPAVSGHHARVVLDGDHYVLEDLNSRNGTFVGEQRVTRHTLREGDVVMVGKHRLVIDLHAHGTGGGRDVRTDAPIPEVGGTVFLDTEQHRALLEKLRAAQAPGVPAAAAKLRVVSGRSERPEYRLDSHTSIIGKAPTALVQLRGWFKPAMAVAITRKADKYVAAQLGGRAFVNDQVLGMPRELKDGDVLRVSGLTLEFRAG